MLENVRYFDIYNSREEDTNDKYIEGDIIFDRYDGVPSDYRMRG